MRQYWHIVKTKTRTLFPLLSVTIADIDTIFENLAGFTKKEREWLKTKLKPALKTVHGVSGRNVSITDSDVGQTVNASDCQPCP